MTQPFRYSILLHPILVFKELQQVPSLQNVESAVHEEASINFFDMHHKNEKGERWNQDEPVEEHKLYSFTISL